MRNRYAGMCYACNTIVEPGAGHFERRGRIWLVIHAECVKKQREAKEQLKAESRTHAE